MIIVLSIMSVHLSVVNRWIVDENCIRNGPMLLLSVLKAFRPYCSMLLSVIYRKSTNGDDATTLVVLFCKQSHLGCTDMGLHQNRDNNA